MLYLPSMCRNKHTLLTRRANFIWFVMRNSQFHNLKDIYCGHVKKFVMLSIIVYIFIRFGSKLFRQIVDIQMGTNCALHVADFFVCFVMKENSLSTSSNLDNLLNIDNPSFAQMISQIYLTELQLNWVMHDVVTQNIIII